MKVFLNGSMRDAAEATVPVTDRGFLFADGVYEVVRVYGGAPVFFDEHLARLRDGLAALEIDWGGADDLPDIAARLIGENHLDDADATVYVQVTRGAPPRRSHAFPEDVDATVYVAVQAYPRHPEVRYEDGVGAILVDDLRWKRRDIKSIALLPNVLANQQAHAAQAFEALFVEDGNVLEGSHSNLFAVLDGVVRTHPLSPAILPGITRAVALGLAREAGLPTREEPLPKAALEECQELFLTGTTTEIMPVCTVDGRPVGDGRPGPVSRALQAAYSNLAARRADAYRTAPAGSAPGP